MRKTDTEPLTDGEGISAASIGTGNAGFIYERDVILALRNSGFTVSDPAGADSAKADLELTSGFKTIKFELKEKLSADFAQMNFDFDTTSKQFFIDKTKTTAKKEAAQTMIGIAEEFDIIRQANEHWNPKKNMPAKFVVKSSAPFADRDKARKLDIKRFPDKFLAKGVEAAQQVEKYYNSKDTYYIQVKGRGLYYMGKDPEGYGCPRFSNSVTDSSIRIRIKTNSASKARWSFLMALKINGLRARNRDLDLDSSFLSS